MWRWKRVSGTSDIFLGGAGEIWRKQTIKVGKAGLLVLGL